MTIIQILGKHSIHFKASKYKFHTQETEHLGFVISLVGIKMDLVKIQAIMESEIPENIHDVQVFVGFVNFYQKFIKEFS